MATQLSLVQGEVRSNDEMDARDIECLLAGLLRALLDEQETQKREGE